MFEKKKNDNNPIHSQTGKVFILNWNFSSFLEDFITIGNFLKPFEKPDPVLYREKAQLTFEPPREKTNNLHMRKQRRRSASR